MLGTFALSSGYQDQYYSKAQQARELLRYEFGLALETCDALLTPVAPTYAYKLGEKTADPMEMYMGDLLHCACEPYRFAQRERALRLGGGRWRTPTHRYEPAGGARQPEKITVHRRRLRT